jgi:hypothetical protein
MMKKLIHYIITNNTEKFMEKYKNTSTIDNNRLLEEAAYYGNEDIVNAIIDNCDISEDPHNHSLICAVLSENINIIKKILDKGASINCQNGKIFTIVDDKNNEILTNFIYEYK